MENIIRFQKREGNYIKAIEECNRISAEGNLAIDKQIDIGKKIEALKELHKKVSALQIGEAFFPVAGQNGNNSAVYSIQITNEKQHDIKSNEFQENWKHVKKIIAFFLDTLLDKNNIYVTVFDWKFDEYFCCIKKLLSNDEPIENKITGSSLQLAMAVALISKIINKKVDDKFAFSGILKANSKTVEIGAVNSIEKKKSAIQREREHVSEFIYSQNNSDLNEMLNKVFDESYLNDIVKSYVKGNTEYIELVKKNKVTAFVNKGKAEITLLKFHHKNITTAEAVKKLNVFFEKLDITSKTNGIILDGLKPNFAYGMIMPLFFNKIEGFLAFTNMQIPKLNNFSNAAVVVNKAKMCNTDIGEFVYYGESETFPTNSTENTQKN